MHFKYTVSFLYFPSNFVICYPIMKEEKDISLAELNKHKIAYNSYKYCSLHLFI